MLDGKIVIENKVTGCMYFYEHMTNKFVIVNRIQDSQSKELLKLLNSKQLTKLPVDCMVQYKCTSSCEFTKSYMFVVGDKIIVQLNTGTYIVPSNFKFEKSKSVDGFFNHKELLIPSILADVKGLSDKKSEYYFPISPALPYDEKVVEGLEVSFSVYTSMIRVDVIEVKSNLQIVTMRDILTLEPKGIFTCSLDELKYIDDDTFYEDYQHLMFVNVDLESIAEFVREASYLLKM